MRGLQGRPCKAWGLPREYSAPCLEAVKKTSRIYDALYNAPQGARRGDRPSPWLLPAPLLCAVALAACTARTPPSAVAPLRLGAYAGQVAVTATYRGRGFAFRAGCAVDPAAGARLEVRDPMGGTRLLLLLRPDAGEFLSPGTGEEAVWDGGSEELPWNPLDLWTLLAAVPPPHRDTVSYDAIGRLVSCRWSGRGSILEGRFFAAKEGAFPYASATLAGPGAARLEVRWAAVRPAAPPEGFLARPASLAFAAVPLDRLLEGVSR